MASTAINLETYQKALDCLPNALLIIDEQSTIACVNKTALVLLGYSQNELKGLSLTKVFKPRQDSLLYEQPLQVQTIQPGQVYLVDCIKKDAPHFPAEIKVMLNSYFSQNARTISFRDVSEQVERQKKWQKDVYYSDFIVQHANEFFLACSSNLAITNVSSQSKHVLGHSKEAFLNKTLYNLQEYVYGPDQDKYRQILSRLQEKKADYTFEDTLSVIQAVTRLVSEFGEIIPIEWFVSYNHQLRSSETEYYVGAARKITDRLAAEETERKRSTEESEAKKRGAVKFITLMLAALQEPIMSLETFLKEFSKFTNLSSEQKVTLINLRTYTQQIRHVLNDLEKLLQPEMRSPSPHFFNEFQCEQEEFSLRQVVTLAIGQCTKQAKAKNLHLLMEGFEEIPDKLIGDPSRLVQVLANLLSNAIKFTKVGSVTIRVQNENCEQDKMIIRLEVIDTGVGIVSEDIPKLFQPFSQLQEGKALGKIGSGLGLRICHLIISKMGGTIGAISEAGKGSTFYILLPTKRSLI